MVEKMGPPGRVPPEVKGPKPPPKPETPPEGEVLFVGEGKPEGGTKAPQEKTEAQTRAEKPILSKDKIAPLKLAKASPEVIFEHALQHDPEFAKVLGAKPIANENLRRLLADSIVGGDSLREAALKIKDARLARQIGAGEADFLLARISNVIGEPILVEVSGGAGAAFFDKKNPGTAKSREAQKALQKIQGALDKDPSLEADTRFLNQAALDLAKSDLPATEVKEYIEKLRRFQTSAEKAFEQAREQARERTREFSSMWLTSGEREGMRDNPRWTVEDVLRRVEETTVLFPDTPAAEAATRRLGLMSEYFSHKQYEIDIEDYIKLKGWKSTSSQAIEHRSRATTMYRELSQKISVRTSIHKAFGIIRGVGDPESIWKSLITVGEAGLEHLMNENGGLNEIVFNRYVQIFKHHRYNPDGSLKRITGEELYLIRKKVEKAIIDDRALYDEIYKQAGYFQTDPKTGRLITDRDKKPIARGLTDEDCRAVVRQAEYLVTMSQQDLVAMLGGRGPGEIAGGISSFESASTAEKLLAAMDINRWFFEKWTNLRPGQLVVWQNACRLAVETEGKVGIIEGKLQGVKKGDDKFKNLVRETFGPVDPKKKGLEIDEEILKRAKKALEIREMQRTGHYAEIKAKDLKDPKEQELMWNRLSLDFLRDQMMVAEGEKIVGGLLEVYDHFSSGWRIGIHTDQLEKIWGKGDGSKPGDYGGVLGLGMRLRKAGYGYVSAETDVKREEALGSVEVEEGGAKKRKGLKGELDKVAEYRPQALFEFLSDAEDIEAKNWFGKNLYEGVFREAINQHHELHQAIARRFLAINEKLAIEGQSPINYATGPNREQRKIVEYVCKLTTTDTDKYLEMMKEMSGFVVSDYAIKELTSVKYNRIYYRTQWLDDARLRYLEKTGSYLNEKKERKTVVPGDIREDENMVPLSQVFTDRGQGDVDALVRSWRDGATGMKSVQNVFAALTPDEKTYLKNIVELNQNVAIYSGSDYATRATLYLLGGWGKTAKTDAIFDWLYLGGLDETSAMKRMFGNRAPSLGLNELEEFIEQHDHDLLSKMEFLAPHAFHAVERYLGITTGALGREFKLPLYVYRARLYIAIAAILIAAEAAKNAGKSLNEGKS